MRSVSAEIKNSDLDSLVLQVHLSRVFVFRCWLGTQLLKLAMWVIGGHAEVIPPE